MLQQSYLISIPKISKDLRISLRLKLSLLKSIYIITSENDYNTFFYVLFDKDIEANIVLKRINEIKQIIRAL